MLVYLAFSKLVVFATISRYFKEHYPHNAEHQARTLFVPFSKSFACGPLYDLARNTVVQRRPELAFVDIDYERAALLTGNIFNVFFNNTL